MKTIKNLWRLWGIRCIKDRMRELDDTERLCRLGIRVCIQERHVLIRELLKLENERND